MRPDAFGITPLRENGRLNFKTDAKEKADICTMHFQSASTREGDSDPPSKGASPFSSMGGITVDPKGVAKLLDGRMDGWMDGWMDGKYAFYCLLGGLSLIL